MKGTRECSCSSPLGDYACLFSLFSCLLPEVLTSPVSGRCLVFCGFAIVASTKVSSPLLIFVLSKVLVISVSVTNFLYLISLLGEDDKLLF